MNVFTKSLIAVTTGMALILGASSGFVANAEDTTQSSEQSKGKKGKKRFETMDVDGSGAISLAEFSAGGSKGPIGRADSNGDGTIDASELSQADEKTQKRLTKRFDANGDGTIDAGEIAAQRNEQFTKMDTDGNGEISMEEFTAKSKGKKRKKDK